MDVRYNSENGNLSISFTPVETREFALLMELVFEDEWERGTCVPDLNKEFFRTFATSIEKVKIDFDFDYLEFCLVFLEEVYYKMLDDGVDSAELGSFLSEVSEFCSAGGTIH